MKHTCEHVKVTFAVVRVITAMFLKATLSASDSEERSHAVVAIEQALSISLIDRRT